MLKYRFCGWNGAEKTADAVPYTEKRGDDTLSYLLSPGLILPAEQGEGGETRILLNGMDGRETRHMACSSFSEPGKTEIAGSELRTGVLNGQIDGRRCRLYP